MDPQREYDSYKEYMKGKITTAKLMEIAGILDKYELETYLRHMKTAIDPKKYTKGKKPKINT